MIGSRAALALFSQLASDDGRTKAAVMFGPQALGAGEYLQDGEVGKVSLWHPVNGEV